MLCVKEMGSDLTSLITKIKRFLSWGLLVLLLGCSSAQQKSADEEAIKLAEELDSLTNKVQVQNVGPTNPSSTAFKDRTADYGLEGLSAVAINAVDINFDGRVDLVLLPTYYARPKFMIFDAKEKKFKAWTHDPLPEDFKASFILFYDFNRDKVVDIISGVLNQRSEVSQLPLKLYLGKITNGLINFTEDPKAFKLPAEPTSSVSVIDYDLDGWPDLFISNWFGNKNGEYFPVADRLMRNVRGRFEEVTPLLRGEANKTQNQLYPPNAKPTYGSSTCDIDQNGYPDILTVSSSGNKNKLWMNLKESRSGEKYFQDIGAESNYGSDPDGSLIPTGGGRSFFSSCTDYNDDGIMDIFLGELSHAYDNESVDKSSILSGSRETYPPYFIRTEYLSDVNSESWNQGDRRAAWLDYNLDGRIDFVVDNSGFPPYSRLVLFHQDEGHGFINVAGQLGIDIVNPVGTVTLDVNADGSPDLLTSQNSIRRADIPPRLYLFENQAKEVGSRAIKVNLRGIKSNTEAIGAMVMLYTKKNNKKIVQRRWVEYSQGGLPSQNESGILFGLAAGVDAVGLKVRWPLLKKNNTSSGVVVEKLYSLSTFPADGFLEVTVCEDGKILAGKISCQF